jgi:poly-beta-1,6-N-acetyl-D-glucosamine synthase
VNSLIESAPATSFKRWHRFRDAMAARVLLISPVRNEATHIERVVRAVAAQEVPPDRWLVIDDASTDGTLELLRSLEAEVPFMTVLEAQRDVRHGGARDRLARAAAPRNFNTAMATVNWREYTHVMKLDGDIEMKPDYLGVMLERFSRDPRLGIAGCVLDEPTSDGGFRRIRVPPHHVHGAVKCYSKDCLETIGGVQERLGWDTIDETYARMLGFSTVTFRDVVALHHRPWATADGVLRGRARHGECAYISQYPVVWVTLRSLKVACNSPKGISGIAFLFGYIRAAIRRTARVEDPAYRRFTRRELHLRMVDAVSDMVARPFRSSTLLARMRET